MDFVLFVKIFVVVKSYLIVFLKCVNFYVCKLFLGKVNEEREG